MAEQFTRIEVKDGIGRFVKSSVDFTYENGIRDAEAIFSQLVELLTVALALNPDSVFYLCKIAGSRLQAGVANSLMDILQDVISTIDSIPPEGDPGSVAPIEDFSSLDDANSQLAEISLSISKGVDSTPLVQSFSDSIDDFIGQTDSIADKVTKGNISNYRVLLGDYYTNLSSQWITWWEEVNLVCSVLEDYLVQRVDLKIVSTTIDSVRSYLSEIRSALDGKTSDVQTSESRSGLLNLVSSQNILEMSIASSDPRQQTIISGGTGVVSFDPGETEGTTLVEVSSLPDQLVVDLFSSGIRGRDYLIIPDDPPGNPIAGWYKIKSIVSSSVLELESKIPIMSEFSGVIGTGDGATLEFTFDLTDPPFNGVKLDETSFSARIGGELVDPSLYVLSGTDPIWLVDFTKYAAPANGVDVRASYSLWVEQTEESLSYVSGNVWATSKQNLQIDTEVVQDGVGLIRGIDYYIDYNEGLITFGETMIAPTASYIYRMDQPEGSIGTGDSNTVLFNLTTSNLKEYSESILLDSDLKIRGLHYMLQDDGTPPSYNWKVNFTYTASHPDTPIEADFYYQLQDTIDFDIVRGSAFDDDYIAMLSSLTIGVTGEVLGVGDGLTKLFQFVNKPVLRHSVTVTIDEQEALQSLFTIDYTNGAVIFIDPPEDGVEISVDYYYFSIGSPALPSVLTYLNELLIDAVTLQTAESKTAAKEYAQDLIDGINFFFDTFNDNIGQVPRDARIDSVVSILEDQSLDRGSLAIQKADLESFYSLTSVTASSRTKLIAAMSNASTLRDF